MSRLEKALQKAKAGTKQTGTETASSDDKEIGYAELRTTEAKHMSDRAPFEKGCPSCGANPVITKTRMFDRDCDNMEIRNCLCRACGWEGQLLKAA